MRKISQYLARDIANAVCAVKIDKEIDAQHKVLLAIGDKIYADIYKGLLIKMEDLPNGWLPMQSFLYVKLGAKVELVNFTKERIVLDKHASHRYSVKCAHIYEATEPLAIEWTLADIALKDLNKKRSKLQEEAKAIIYSCSSTKKLKEVWPEVASIVEAVERKYNPVVPNLPVDVSSLNQALGLPPEAKAA